MKNDKMILRNKLNQGDERLTHYKLQYVMLLKLKNTQMNGNNTSCVYELEDLILLRS